MLTESDINMNFFEFVFRRLSPNSVFSEADPPPTTLRIDPQLLNSAHPADRFTVTLLLAYELGSENVYKAYKRTHTQFARENAIEYITRVAQYDFLLGASNMAILQDYYDKLLADSNNQSNSSSNSDIL